MKLTENRKHRSLAWPDPNAEEGSEGSFSR